MVFVLRAGAVRLCELLVEEDDGDVVVAGVDVRVRIDELTFDVLVGEDGNRRLTLVDLDAPLAVAVVPGGRPDR